MTLQELTAQTPVGECFEWECEKYKVIDSFVCLFCSFIEKKCTNISCSPIRRFDEKHVIFVKQTPNEK